MRIAQLNPGRVLNALGGTEKVFFAMANAMNNRGHSVGCFFYDTVEGTPLFPVNKNVRLNNCFNKARIKSKKRWAKIKACLYLNKKKRREVRTITRNKLIISDIKSFKPDVIILYWVDPIINELVKLKVPVVLMMHLPPTLFASKPYFPACMPGMEKSSCIQVLMPSAVSEMYQFVKNDNIVHIPNVVPQYETVSNRASHTIIFLGRIAELKRPWILAEAFALLKDKYPDWKVELWGEEHCEPKVAKRVHEIIERRGLENHVICCGPTTNIEDKLNNASIIVMPSSMESFCLAAAEGMSKGLPCVVCKDCETLRTIVRHGENGFHCEPSAEDMAAWLSKLMDSQELREKLGNQAREDMKQYASENIYDKWELELKRLTKM